MKTRLSHFFGSATVSVAVVLITLASGTLALHALAANDYNIRLLVPPLTGDVEQVQLDPSQWSLTLTNFPNGVRRGSLEFVGSGGGGSGSNTVLIAEPGILLTPQGTGTNGIGADFSLIVSNQMTGITLNGGAVVSTADTTDFYPLASNPAGYLTSANGITSLNGVAQLASNNTYSAGTTQSVDTAIVRGSETVSNNLTVIGSGTIEGASGLTINNSLTVSGNGNIGGTLTVGGNPVLTNVPPGSTVVTNLPSDVVYSASNNTYATGTMQTPYNFTIAGNGTASNNFTVVLGLTSQGSFNAQNAGTVTHGLTVDTGTVTGNGTIGTNLTVNGNVSIGGSLTSGNLAGGTGYLSSNLSGQIATSQLARVSNNSGTIGGAGTYLVVTFDPNTGLPIAWTTATGPPAGASTNSVTFLENANNGNTYNNVNGIIFTNVPYFTQNQSTNTLGFSNVVFDTVQLFVPTNSTGLGTNVVIHGATLSFSNATTQGLSFTLNGSGTLAVSGTISNLITASNQAGNTNQYFGIGTNSVRGAGYHGVDIQTYSPNSIDTMWDLNVGGSASSAEDLGINNYFYGANYNLAAYSGLGQDFWMAIGTSNPSPLGILEWRPSFGHVGLQFDAPALTTVPVADTGLMMDCGTIWTAAQGASAPKSIGNGMVFDQLDVSSTAVHHNYFGVNTNDFGATFKKGQVAPLNSTSVVQNSDWVRVAVFDNSTVKMDYIAAASNMDIIADFFTTGCSSNTATDGFSSSATDALRIKTNTFIGRWSDRNGTFGIFSNLAGYFARDETNGLQMVTVSTNNGGSLWVGPSNNVFQTSIGDLYSGNSNLWWSVNNGTTAAIYKANWP
jgi:hypothetical protein